MGSFKNFYDNEWNQKYVQCDNKLFTISKSINDDLLVMINIDNKKIKLSRYQVKELINYLIKIL